MILHMHAHRNSRQSVGCLLEGAGAGRGRDSALSPAVVPNVEVSRVCRFDAVAPSAFNTQSGAISGMFSLQNTLPD